jgi:hypothetical protein
MPDPLYLSVWLTGYSPLALTIYFQRILEVFPYSQLKVGSVLRVYAVSFQEVPVFEGFIDTAMNAAEAADIVQEFVHDDCCIQLETKWDLYQWDGSWELKPSRVRIEVYGPRFERDALNPLGEPEAVCIDLGPEDTFLPVPQSDQLRHVQSNIRSILHLADDLRGVLAVNHGVLWSETEDNFAERLRLLLDE